MFGQGKSTRSGIGAGSPSRSGSSRSRTSARSSSGLGRTSSRQSVRSSKSATRTSSRNNLTRKPTRTSTLASSRMRASGHSSRSLASRGLKKREAEAKQPGVKRIKFDVNTLDLRATLGTGSFGRVRLVRHPNGKYYALKILKKSEIIRLKQVDHIKSEVKILSMINHPFVVNLMGHTQSSSHLYMLLQYVPGGELFSYLRREVRISNDAAKFYASEIVLAFQHLHSFNIVYRDLKPENLLVTRQGHLKITDFGFAKVVDDKTWTLCGTPEYLAPELIQSKGHNKFPPFYDETPFGIYKKILAGRIDFPRYFDVKAKDLIRKLLASDVSQRLGCLRNGGEDVKNHKWFGRLNWDAVYACKLPPPFVPEVRSADDTRNFDKYPDSTNKPLAPLTPEQRELFAEFDRL